MATKYFISDGGRSQFPEYEHEQGDCAIRALANSGLMDYMQAHCMFKIRGRKDRNGVVGSLLFDVFSQYGDYNYSTAKLGEWVKKNKRGIYLLDIGDHTLTVKNGVICDTYETELDSTVNAFWRVK